MALNYNFLRDNDLNDKEFRLLLIIDSFSKFCHLKQVDIARAMKTSIPSVKRTMKSLKEKGLIEVNYGHYKSIHISIIEKEGITIKITRDPIDQFKRIKSDTHKDQIQQDVGSPVIQPNKEPTKNKYKNRNSFVFNKGRRVEIHVSKHPGLGKDEIPVPEEALRLLRSITGRQSN